LSHLEDREEEGGGGDIGGDLILFLDAPELEPEPEPEPEVWSSESAEAPETREADMNLEKLSTATAAVAAALSPDECVALLDGSLSLVNSIVVLRCCSIFF